MSKYTAFIHTDKKIGKMSINALDLDLGGGETIINIYNPDGSDVWSGTFQQLIKKLVVW